MNPATIIFGYCAAVQAPAASFASLNKTWTKSLQEHNVPYFNDEKHAVVTASPMVALEDKMFGFRAIFGVEIDWHDWPAISGYTVGFSSGTGVSNVSFDIDALPTGRKLLERRIKYAKKLKKNGPLKPIELSFESKEPRAFLVGPVAAPIRLFFGCIVDEVPASLPKQVATHELGDSALVGFELATLESGERVLGIAIDPDEETLFGKSEDQWGLRWASRAVGVFGVGWGDRHPRALGERGIPGSGRGEPLRRVRGARQAGTVRPSTPPTVSVAGIAAGRDDHRRSA